MNLTIKLLVLFCLLIPEESLSTFNEANSPDHVITISHEPIKFENINNIMGNRVTHKNESENDMQLSNVVDKSDKKFFSYFTQVNIIKIAIVSAIVVTVSVVVLWAFTNANDKTCKLTLDAQGNVTVPNNDDSFFNRANCDAIIPNSTVCDVVFTNNTSNITSAYEGELTKKVKAIMLLEQCEFDSKDIDKKCIKDKLLMHLDDLSSQELSEEQLVSKAIKTCQQPLGPLAIISDSKTITPSYDNQTNTITKDQSLTPSAKSSTDTKTREQSETGTLTPSAKSSSYTISINESQTETSNQTESKTQSETVNGTASDSETRTKSDASLSDSKSKTSTFVSNTNQRSNSATATESASKTATASASATQTQTMTATGTSNETETETPSASKTKTASDTGSKTQSVTATETASASATKTVSETATATASASATQTVSASKTKTVSDTGSKTQSETGTETLSETGSKTQSATATATASASATQTVSDTGSKTQSVTGTETLSETGSKTQSVTATETQSATVTATASASKTETVSASKTETASDTGSKTQSETGTETQSATATATASASATQTVSETGSKTQSVTETETQSVTATATASASASQTASETESKTQSVTATGTSNETETETQSVTATATATKPVVCYDSAKVNETLQFSSTLERSNVLQYTNLSFVDVNGTMINLDVSVNELSFSGGSPTSLPLASYIMEVYDPQGHYSCKSHNHFIDFTELSIEHLNSTTYNSHPILEASFQTMRLYNITKNSELVGLGLQVFYNSGFYGRFGLCILQPSLLAPQNSSMVVIDKGPLTTVYTTTISLSVGGAQVRIRSTSEGLLPWLRTTSCSSSSIFNTYWLQSLATGRQFNFLSFSNPCMPEDEIPNKSGKHVGRVITDDLYGIWTDTYNDNSMIYYCDKAS